MNSQMLLRFRRCGTNSSSLLAGLRAQTRRNLHRSSVQGNALEHNLMSVGQVVEYSGFRQMVMTFPKRKPFLTNVGLSLVVSVAGDCCAQKAEGKKNNRLAACWLVCFMG